MQKHSLQFITIVALAVLSIFLLPHGAHLEPVSAQETQLVKPDLSVIKTAPATVSWDGMYSVTYRVTNLGAKVAQANMMEPYSSGMTNDLTHVFIPTPITFASLSGPTNRVSCGRFGGNMRCLFMKGIEAGETLEFSLLYEVLKRPVQCDAMTTTAPAQILPGMNFAVSIQSSLNTDANPADNTSGATQVRIDCTSIAGDLQTEITGPSAITAGEQAEYIITLRNVGTTTSAMVPVQISVPRVGYDLLGAQSIEPGGICSRVRDDAVYQMTCSNPTVRLAPAQSVSFKIQVRARSADCTSDQITALINKSLHTPMVSLSEIYDANDANNAASLGVSCLPSSSSSSSTSSSSTSSSSSSSSSTASSSSSSSCKFWCRR
ncbi:MAG TPA: hypothetical protein VJB82_03665 [Candidatus Peribacterales bacterium]|nr:hypothetical protein [Candidatus Peribacterales bacterium]